jgi:hypothetical protein
MRVFIANFGRANYLWPECRERKSVAVLDDEDVHPFWLARDRPGYIAYCETHKKTAAGIAPTRPVASRWYNLLDIVSETEDDLWFHREKDELWWTHSTDAAPATELAADPGGQRVYVVHKQCQPWSDRSKSGGPLRWPALHPRAKTFLFTEGTLQQLTEDNARYARALRDGASLDAWHDRPDWQKKRDAAGHGAATHLSPIQRAAIRLAQTAMSTVANARGQDVLRTTKVKEMHFSQPELEKYVVALIQSQEGLCALTELPLELDGTHEDDEMLPSLDRIDSDGHYAPGNLQVVCRFANRWKNDDKDENFRRLVRLLRGA